jgi:hypothetical protein
MVGDGAVDGCSDGAVPAAPFAPAAERRTGSQLLGALHKNKRLIVVPLPGSASMNYATPHQANSR